MIPLLMGATLFFGTLVSFNSVAQSKPFETGWVDSKKSVYHKSKIAIHLNQMPTAKQLERIKNSFNQMLAADPKADIKVVVHGEALALFIDQELAAEQKEFLDVTRSLGVQYLICHTSLRMQKVTLAQLYKVAHNDIVPAAVLELAKLQKQGYAYIRYF